jgi:hypothetical protein
MNQKDLKRIIAEQLDSDPEIKKLLRKMVDSLESIDTSIDFVAAGLTGGTARGIDIAQRRSGRLNPGLTVSPPLPPPPPATMNERSTTMNIGKLKKMIAEELSKLREAMPLPLDDEGEDDRFTADQREQDHRLENPGLYAGDEEEAEEMASRSSLGRAKELMRAVEVGAAAVRAGEDSDLLTDDALQAAKAAMLEDPDATGDEVEDAIYAALYYEYFPEMLR